MLNIIWASVFHSELENLSIEKYLNETKSSYSISNDKASKFNSGHKATILNSPKAIDLQSFARICKTDTRVFHISPMPLESKHIEHNQVNA